METYNVIRRPLITEKNTNAQTYGKYVFEADYKANKRQIKEAIEKAFKVKVTAVNVVIMPGTMKRVGQRVIATTPYKKAVVTLQAGDKIQIFEGV